jgi:ABC-type long-subunit fatty acid transport system fused permease/ATPase subunit
MIKQIVFSLLLLAIFVALTGCSSGKAVGMSAPGLTKEQVNQRHYEAIRVDRWQLQDDIDAVFLFDRPGRMHRLTVR